MNTKEAIAALAKNGVKVDQIGRNQFRVWDQGGEPKMAHRARGRALRSDIYKDDVWSGRDVVEYEKNCNNNRSGNLKHYDNRKNRTATRDAIQKEDFDSIPLKGKTKEENPYSWD